MSACAALRCASVIASRAAAEDVRPRVRVWPCSDHGLPFVQRGNDGKRREQSQAALASKRQWRPAESDDRGRRSPCDGALSDDDSIGPAICPMAKAAVIGRARALDRPRALASRLLHAGHGRNHERAAHQRAPLRAPCRPKDAAPAAGSPAPSARGNRPERDGGKHGPAPRRRTAWRAQPQRRTRATRRRTRAGRRSPRVRAPAGRSPAGCSRSRARRSR